MSTLLIDKSAFQALNPEELGKSRGRYQLLVTDILLLELLGDLRYNDQRTQYLAQKLRSAEVVVNMPYHLICGAELMGEPVPMQGIPLLQGLPMRNSSGETGFLVARSVGDISLERWAKGEFGEGDVERARMLVGALRNFDLLEQSEHGTRAAIARNDLPPSIQEIARRVDESLSDPARQPSLLDTLLAYLPLSEDRKRQIRDRWERVPLSLNLNAPFSSRCLRLLLIFFAAIGSRLIGTRKTNFVDVQYLMYLPFCSRFASGDHVHAALFPFVSTCDQVLVSPNKLKAELGNAGCGV